MTLRGWGGEGVTDDYLLKNDGTIEFLRSREGPDRLFIEGQENMHYNIYDKSLLSSMCGSESSGSTTIGFSSSLLDIKKIFYAGAHYTNKEFQMGYLKNGTGYVGTNRSDEHGLNFIDIGVEPSEVLSMTHSHPGNLIQDAGLTRNKTRYSQFKAEQVSMGYRDIIDPSFTKFDRLTPNSDATISYFYKTIGFNGNYFVYMPKSTNLWLISGYNKNFIKKINNNLKKFILK